MNQHIKIKPLLEAIKIGDSLPFPLSKRASVRSTTSNMRLDGFLFKTQMRIEDNLIVVTRKQ